MIPRYTLPEMGALWSEQNKFQKWLDVEIAVCEVHAEMGTIPREAVAEIKSESCLHGRAHQRDREDDRPRRNRVHDRAGREHRRGRALRALRADLFATWWTRRTRFCCAMRATCSWSKIDALAEVLKRRAFEFKDTPQIGRTHGVHAEPTSFGLTFALWFDEMRRNRERLERAREAVAVGQDQRRGRRVRAPRPGSRRESVRASRLESRARLDAGHSARHLCGIS